jgi:hypothetical protein
MIKNKSFFVIKDKDTGEFWSPKCTWTQKLECASRFLNKELALGFAQASKELAQTSTSWRGNLEIVEYRIKIVEKKVWAV